MFRVPLGPSPRTPVNTTAPPSIPTSQSLLPAPPLLPLQWEGGVWGGGRCQWRQSRGRWWLWGEQPSCKRLFLSGATSRSARGFLMASSSRSTPGAWRCSGNQMEHWGLSTGQSHTPGKCLPSVVSHQPPGHLLDSSSIPELRVRGAARALRAPPARFPALAVKPLVQPLPGCVTWSDPHGGSVPLSQK